MRTKKPYSNHTKTRLVKKNTPSLFDKLGGKKTLEKVHVIFYNKVYSHSQLSIFFVNQPQKLIENQQTAFMAEKMGGPKEYVGKPPKYTHLHMYITNEIFDLRSQLLEEALVEANIPLALRNRWLKIDSAFRQLIVKNDPVSFNETYTFRQKIIVGKP